MESQTHQSIDVRTTLELPDELYRSLKARAALSGVPLRLLVQRLIEHGLGSAVNLQRDLPRRREPPPVIIPARGIVIPALAPTERVRIEEEEDEVKHARFG